jgi:hypothetical protein
MFVTGDTLAPRTLQFLEKSGLPYRSRKVAPTHPTAATHKIRNTSRRS